MELSNNILYCIQQKVPFSAELPDLHVGKAICVSGILLPKCSRFVVALNLFLAVFVCAYNCIDAHDLDTIILSILVEDLLGYQTDKNNLCFSYSLSLHILSIIIVAFVFACAKRTYYLIVESFCRFFIPTRSLFILLENK